MTAKIERALFPKSSKPTKCIAHAVQMIAFDQISKSYSRFTQKTPLADNASTPLS